MSIVKIKGVPALMKKLQRLEKRGAKRALRKATTAGTTVLRKAVRAATPVDEGLLKKAQDSKITGRGMRLRGIVGANVTKLEADAAASGPVNQGLLSKAVGALTGAAAATKRPTNIDWLVENGHTTPGGTFVPPSGYMRRAADGAMPAAEARFVAKLRESIEQEAAQ